jgi:hypothetical protein
LSVAAVALVCGAAAGLALGVVANSAQAKPIPNRKVNLLWHGGAIMRTANITAIYWGTSWPSDTSDKIAGLDAFYSGLNGSNYARASAEYTGSNGQVGAGSTYGGHVIDGSAAPTNPPTTSMVLQEVAKMIFAPDPSGNGYYPVYTDLPRGGANYCAWHSSGMINGVQVQFAFFFNLDGDVGCDPQDTSGLHSQGLAALANMSAAKYSETVTDPSSGGWYDNSGQENADKCAWTFGAPLVTFSNGTQWKLQGEWSNAAFNAGTGYPNRAGQNGCLSGL